MELILDYSTWRCGGDNFNYNILGEGKTQLLNSRGFMCCLGQFTPQLNPNISKEKIEDLGNPFEVSQNLKIGIKSLTKRMEDEYTDTVLSTKAININDDKLTTPDEKITKLKSLFKRAGHTIKVINKP